MQDDQVFDHPDQTVYKGISIYKFTFWFFTDAISTPWLPWGHHPFLLTQKWFPESPEDLAILPLQWDPWPCCRGTLTWACQLLRSTPDTGYRDTGYRIQECQEKSAALPALGIHMEPVGSVQSCSWAVTCQEPDHRQKLLENKPQPKLNLKWASSVHSGTVPLGTLHHFIT